MNSIVIDTNLAIAQVLPYGYSDQASELIHFWKVAGYQLYAPSLWEYEFISTLRKLVYAGTLDHELAEKVAENIGHLNIHSVAPDSDLNRRSLHWAHLLGQVVAYDAQILALAESLRADFFTADRKIASAAQNAGAEWVHWVGENQ